VPLRASQDGEQRSAEARTKPLRHAPRGAFHQVRAGQACVVPGDSQAQSASSILVTRSMTKALVGDQGLVCCLRPAPCVACHIRARCPVVRRCAPSPYELVEDPCPSTDRQCGAGPGREGLACEPRDSLLRHEQQPVRLFLREPVEEPRRAPCGGWPESGSRGHPLSTWCRPRHQPRSSLGEPSGERGVSAELRRKAICPSERIGPQARKQPISRRRPKALSRWRNRTCPSAWAGSRRGQLPYRPCRARLLICLTEPHFAATALQRWLIP
jgi:hypothetical protein